MSVRGAERRAEASALQSDMLMLGEVIQEADLGEEAGKMSFEVVGKWAGDYAVDSALAFVGIGWSVD